jgi:hypothetical protein
VSLGYLGSLEAMCLGRPNRKPYQMQCGPGTAFFLVVEFRDSPEPMAGGRLSREGERYFP